MTKKYDDIGSKNENNDPIATKKNRVFLRHNFMVIPGCNKLIFYQYDAKRKTVISGDSSHWFPTLSADHLQRSEV